MPTRAGDPPWRRRSHEVVCEAATVSDAPWRPAPSRGCPTATEHVDLDARVDRPLRDVVADAVRAQITSGVLVPGTRIREEQLAVDHGVSRVPVREALQLLQSEGFLDLAPRRGATVVTPSATKVLELMEIRRALEVLAAGRAAERRGGEQASALRRLVDDGVAALARGHHSALPPLTDRFHVLVAEASESAELVSVLDNLRSRVRWMFAVDIEHRSETAWREHADLCEAVLTGDVSGARRLMDVHVKRDEDDYRSSAATSTAP